MQRRIYKLPTVLILVLLVFTISGCTGSNSAITVNTAVAKDQDIQATLDFSGVLIPAETVDIASKISGQVTNLNFKVGSAVKAGDILMQIDTESLNGQLIQAEAGLQSAQAAAQAAKSQVSLAKINLDAAQKSYDRNNALYDSGAISLSDLEDAHDELSIAQRQYENASGPALNQAAAAVTTAQASIKNLNIQINNATIRSPLNGIITSQNVNVGQLVSPNVAVISVIDTSTLKMKTSVIQDKLLLLSQGQQVAVTIDGYPDAKFSGIISSIGPIALSTGEVFPVEITIKNNGQLMAGLSAHGSLTVKTHGVAVPSSSILEKNGQSYVFIIKNQIAALRTVTVGIKGDKETQILKGLNAGERVAVSNINNLTDQMKVTPK